MPSNALSFSMPISTAAPKGRILCVDDEPNILRALCWLLNKDFLVTTAGSAREGLERLTDGDFDVVISDQNMPGMSGVDFLCEVRRLAPRAMRILLTGYSDMQAVLRSVNEAEIFRYVSKPWDVAELPALIAQAAEIARQQQDMPAVSALTRDASAARPKLLVLDDDEAVHLAVELSAGDLAEVVHATSPVDALRILDQEEIGIILAERTLGTMDLTHLLCLLKRQYPQIVSIVLTETMDSNLIAKMVNQGQIYRFLPKPVKAAFLRQTLKSALNRRAELLDNPALGDRYQVEAVGLDAKHLFPDLADTAALAIGSPGEDGRPSGNRSLSGQIGGFMRRILGG